VSAWQIKANQLLHVLPIDDYKPHFEEDCWCNPIEDEGIIIHNSMDKREEYENNKKKSS
jgi:hypothetical protein